MAVQERLLALMVELRLPILTVVAVAVAFISLLAVGPSLATVVSFFWPLLVSTGFFLAAVALLLRISPPPGESTDVATGEEIMHYVAGRAAEAFRDLGDGGGRGEEAEPEEEVEHQKS
ncbi:uncharacterized protein [Typha latifolia]|uniref:uncharacterized protein n=1 Tax=Typha latifolia TaxID=4733 RepID=UPI003C2DF4EB